MSAIPPQTTGIPPQPINVAGVAPMQVIPTSGGINVAQFYAKNVVGGVVKAVAGGLEEIGSDDMIAMIQKPQFIREMSVQLCDLQPTITNGLLLITGVSYFTDALNFMARIISSKTFYKALPAKRKEPGSYNNGKMSFTVTRVMRGCVLATMTQISPYILQTIRELLLTNVSGPDLLAIKPDDLNVEAQKLLDLIVQKFATEIAMEQESLESGTLKEMYWSRVCFADDYSLAKVMSAHERDLDIRFRDRSESMEHMLQSIARNYVDELERSLFLLDRTLDPNPLANLAHTFFTTSGDTGMKQALKSANKSDEGTLADSYWVTTSSGPLSLAAVLFVTQKTWTTQLYKSKELKIGTFVGVWSPRTMSTESMVEAFEPERRTIFSAKKPAWGSVKKLDAKKLAEGNVTELSKVMNDVGNEARELLVNPNKPLDDRIIINRLIQRTVSYYEVETDKAVAVQVVSPVMAAEVLSASRPVISSITLNGSPTLEDVEMWLIHRERRLAHEPSPSTKVIAQNSYTGLGRTEFSSAEFLPAVLHPLFIDRTAHLKWINDKLERNNEIGKILRERIKTVAEWDDAVKMFYANTAGPQFTPLDTNGESAKSVVMGACLTPYAVPNLEGDGINSKCVFQEAKYWGEISPLLIPYESIIGLATRFCHIFGEFQSKVWAPNVYNSDVASKIRRNFPDFSSISVAGQLTVEIDGDDYDFARVYLVDALYYGGSYVQDGLAEVGEEKYPKTKAPEPETDLKFGEKTFNIFFRCMYRRIATDSLLKEHFSVRIYAAVIISFLSTPDNIIKLATSFGVFIPMSVDFVRRDVLMTEDALMCVPEAMDDVFAPGKNTIDRHENRGSSLKCTMESKFLSAPRGLRTGAMRFESISATPRIDRSGTTPLIAIEGDRAAVAAASAKNQSVKSMWGQYVKRRETFPSDAIFVPLIGRQAGKKISTTTHSKSYYIRGMTNNFTDNSEESCDRVSVFYAQNPKHSGSPLISNLGGILSLIYTPVQVSVGQELMNSSFAPLHYTNPTSRAIGELMSFNVSPRSVFTEQHRHYINSDLLLRESGRDNVDLGNPPEDSSRLPKFNIDRSVFMDLGIALQQSYFDSRMEKSLYNVSGTPIGNEHDSKVRARRLLYNLGGGSFTTPIYAEYSGLS